MPLGEALAGESGGSEVNGRRQAEGDHPICTNEVRKMGDTA
jgi:hypothetical protein